MTTYDPIYLSEAEHSLLDHSDVPGVPQSGASVADAMVLAYTTDSVTGGSLVFDTPGTNVGTDLIIDGDGFLEFAVEQRAVISLDLNLATDATADGYVRVQAVYSGGTALPDASYLSWGNDQYVVPVYPDQANLSCNVTLPEDSFDVGNVISFSVQHFGAGAVTVEGMIYARRTA